MKKVILWIAAGLVCSAAVTVRGQEAFTYQGQLKQQGVPLSEQVDMKFTLFDSESATEAVAGPLLFDGIFFSPIQVSNGLFSAELDFGAGALQLGQWLEIEVRSPHDSSDANPYTALTPRQRISAAPFALSVPGLATTQAGVEVEGDIHALGQIAASAYTSNSPLIFKVNPLDMECARFDDANCFLGLGIDTPQARLHIGGDAGVDGIMFPDGTLQTTAAGNIVGGVNGSGTTNSIPFWSDGTTLGNSQITQSVEGVQLPNGVQLAAGAQGNQVRFGSPNGETGMTISGATGRSDVRFDGTTLRLLAGPAGGPPSNGIAITSTGVQLPNGVQLASGAQGNQVQFGSPNGETGMTISGAGGRADLRYDGTLKLVNGPGGIPPATNGIAIDTSGNVGIGTTAPIAKLDVENSQSGKSAVFGRETGTNGVGTYGEATASSGVGVFARNLNGVAIYADGNAAQARGNGGMVKAMVLMHYDGEIPSFVRCYNGVTGSSSGPNGQCGFTYDHYLSGINNALHTTINFGFPVNDRFISLTPFTVFRDSALGVSIWDFPNAQTIDVRNDYDFYIIVY